MGLLLASAKVQQKNDIRKCYRKKSTPRSVFLLGTVISVLFGGDAGSMFEIAIERGGFVEAEQERDLFECGFRLCFDESLGLRDDVLFDPFPGRGAAGSLSDDL